MSLNEIVHVNIEAILRSLIEVKEDVKVDFEVQAYVQV